MANDKPLCITGQSINGASSAEVQQISHAKKPILVSQSTEVVALTAEEARLVRAYRGMSGSNRIFIYDLAINDAIEAGTKAYSGIHIARDFQKIDPRDQACLSRELPRMVARFAKERTRPSLRLVAGGAA
jgi:hypothetical protein